MVSRFFRISAVESTGASAASYVPAVFVSRALAFLRLLVVAGILGGVGQGEFGLYQPGLELINWMVPLVMLGLADVAERYASKFEHEGLLSGLLRRHWGRLLMTGGAAVLTFAAAAPWVCHAVWGPPTRAISQMHEFMMLGACAVTVMLLALYQHVAATLRGLRAYAAAAGMEVCAAVLLLVLSGIAAWMGSAVYLLGAYAVSLVGPLLVYGGLLHRHARSVQPVPRQMPELPHLSKFAKWTLIRLLLTMPFGLIAMISVRWLAQNDAVLSQNSTLPQQQTAEYAMPYRVAQLLAFVGVTLWSSAYGVAAGAWNNQRLRRARAQMLGVGKFGAALLVAIALFVLLGRGILEWMLPVYADAIEALLPPLLGVFLWYSLLGFLATFGDLQERPWCGAAIWGTAVIAQMAMLLAHTCWAAGMSAGWVATYASATGAAVGLVVAVILLWRPLKMDAATVPLALLALSPLGLFAPAWVVTYVGGGTLVAGVIIPQMMGLLLRRRDRLKWAKWRRRHR